MNAMGARMEQMITLDAGGRRDAGAGAVRELPLGGLANGELRTLAVRESGSRHHHVHMVEHRMAQEDASPAAWIVEMASR